MLLEFTPEEYDSIPSPKRTHVMSWVRGALKEMSRDELKDVEVRWAFLIDGVCLSAVGRTKGEALLTLGYGERDYERVKRHGRYDEAVRDGWWVEPAPGSGPLEG